jgi:hypothetical protein
MTHFACHGTHVGLTPSGDGSSEINPEKIRSPRGAARMRGLRSFFGYIAHFPRKSKPYGVANRYFSHAEQLNYGQVVNPKQYLADYLLHRNNQLAASQMG